MGEMVPLKDLASSLLKIYDPGTMDFLKWLNTFEYIIDLLKISDDRKGEFLLHFMESLARSQIQIKVAPADPRSLPYEELVSHYEQLYGIFQGELAANYRFYLRDQFIGETIIHYIVSLTKIVTKGSVSLIDDVIILERFINGLRDPVLKTVLYSETNLKLIDAISIAREVEILQVAILQN